MTSFSTAALGPFWRPQLCQHAAWCRYEGASDKGDTIESLSQAIPTRAGQFLHGCLHGRVTGSISLETLAAPRRLPEADNLIVSLCVSHLHSIFPVSLGPGSSHGPHPNLPGLPVR